MDERQQAEINTVDLGFLPELTFGDINFSDCTVIRSFGLRIAQKSSIIAPLNSQEAERKK
jgi:hypothetical protein